jgi:predicted acylesterase/phospholipase RssA
MRLILILLLFLSCSPTYNKQGTNQEYPAPSTVQQDESLLMFVTISGGGTRAGTMGWRALECLKQIPYTYTTDSSMIKSNLADQIDYISGISGGSFAATGWCIYKDSMSLFRNRFVNRNIQMSLVDDLLFPPWRGLKVLLSPYYSRINVAAEHYDRHVFMKKQFKDLPAHPVLWVNATNLSIANRFVFTPEQLGMMDSDLGSYPVGYACAASSAFPILLNPLTLRNYGKEVPDSILEQDDTYAMAKLNSIKNPEKYYYCKTVEFFNDKRNKWIHLSDGGLVDNQGLQAVLDQFQNNGVINQGLNSDKPLKRLVIVNVNAGMSPPDDGSRKRRAPGIAEVMSYTMTASMDILSAKRWMEIREKCNELWKAKLDGVGQLTDKPFCIELNFRNLPQGYRKACNDLPTSFHLTKKQIALIDSAVPVLMDSSEDLSRLKSSLK